MSGANRDARSKAASLSGRLKDRFEAATGVLDATRVMILGMQPNSGFERKVVNVLNLLTASIKEIKVEQTFLEYSSNVHLKRILQQSALTSVQGERCLRRGTWSGEGQKVDQMEDSCKSKLVAGEHSKFGEEFRVAGFHVVNREEKPCKFKGKAI